MAEVDVAPTFGAELKVSSFTLFNFYRLAKQQLF